LEPSPGCPVCCVTKLVFSVLPLAERNVLCTSAAPPRPGARAGKLASWGCAGSMGCPAPSPAASRTEPLLLLHVAGEAGGPRGWGPPAGPSSGWSSCWGEVPCPGLGQAGNALSSSPSMGVQNNALPSPSASLGKTSAKNYEAH